MNKDKQWTKAEQDDIAQIVLHKIIMRDGR